MLSSTVTARQGFNSNQFNSMPGRERLFRIREADIQQLLFADNSDDDESDLFLDDEDQNFLLEDVDNVTEVIIEHPDPLSTTETSTYQVGVKPVRFYSKSTRTVKGTVASPDVMLRVEEQTVQEPPQPTTSISKSSSRKRPRTMEALEPSEVRKQTLETVDQVLPSPTKSRNVSRSRSMRVDVEFNWKRQTTKVVTDTVDYRYGHVNLRVDEPADINALSVFEEVSDFGTLVSHIVEQSELYMKQKGIVFQTDADELRAFFGICLVMGYHVLPSIRDYWSTQPDLQVPFVSNTMTRTRFETIRSALHFANNENMLPKTDPQFDRAFKVRPLIEHFNRCFQAARNASKQQSIDEHMIKFKGQNIMKQYIRNKPVKWGFKLWCRCDATSGYLYQFDLYTGRKMDTEYGLGESVVVMLSNSLEQLCCQIFIDNFFNSPLLQVRMLQKKIYLCGTVRVDRKFMPKNLKTDKELKRGDWDAMTANGITCVKWMDNRSVTLLSNFLPCKKDEVTHVLRRQAGSAEKLRVSCPTIVTTYNKFMGGVDLMDQKKVSYETDRKSKIKYYLRIFFDLLDIAVNNSHCIFVQMNEERHPNYKAVTPLEYRQMIARSLIGRYTNRQRNTPSAPVRSSRIILPAPKPEHSLIRHDRRKRCAQCAKAGIENRTDSFCETCSVHLCYTKTRNCFAEYHCI